MSIETLLNDFVASKEPGAIVLQGGWGVGKTQFWQRKIAANLLEKPWKKKYSYVSLFGISSLADLKVALAVATDEFDTDAKKQRRQALPVIRFYWKAWAWIGDALLIIPRMGAGLSKFYEKFVFHIVKERVICFDDIERHGRGLDLKDFLGLVSYLVEQRKCRVVVIMNTGQLDEADQKIWSSYREKVFHGEVVYQPTLEETIFLGLADDKNAVWHNVVFVALKELHISNIRLVQRAARFMRLVWSAMGNHKFRPETIDQIGRATTLLAWSAYGSGEGAPPIEFVKKRREYDSLIRSLQKEDSRTDQQKCWDEILSSYGFHVGSTMDHAILNMVVAGVPEAEKLRRGVDEFESHLAKREIKEAYSRAWGLYSNTIAENADEIIDAFDKAWPLIAAYEHSGQLQSVVKLMRELKRDDLATKFISLWIDAQRADSAKELSYRQLHDPEKIDDEEIISAWKNAMEIRGKNFLTIIQAFDKLRSDNVYSEPVIEAFASAKPSDIARALESCGGEDFMRTLKRLEELSGYKEDSIENIAGRNVREACILIARRSPLNARRMRRLLNIDPTGSDRTIE